jgi:diguanylate cyclase (GGDEF)-like protein
LETHSVTTQQLLPLIAIAIGVNAVLIAIALFSMRVTRKRSGQGEGPDFEATHALMLARAAAGADVPAPVMSAAAEGPAPAYRYSGDPSTNWSTPGRHDDVPGDATAGEEFAGLDDTGVELIDPSTGLESPQAWRRAVEDEVTRLARYHRPATVVLVELDGFERFSGRLGQAAGDRVVLATARTLRAHARAADRCARFGQGRFAVLLPETDEVMTINFVERVRLECDRWLEAGEVALRLAIGWTMLDAAEGAAPAIQEAIRRLDAERRQRTGSAV